MQPDQVDGSLDNKANYPRDGFFLASASSSYFFLAKICNAGMALYRTRTSSGAGKNREKLGIVNCHSISSPTQIIHGEKSREVSSNMDSFALTHPFTDSLIIPMKGSKIQTHKPDAASGHQHSLGNEHDVTCRLFWPSETAKNMEST